MTDQEAILKVFHALVGGLTFAEAHFETEEGYGRVQGKCVAVGIELVIMFDRPKEK